MGVQLQVIIEEVSNYYDRIADFAKSDFIHNNRNKHVMYGRWKLTYKTPFLMGVGVVFQLTVIIGNLNFRKLQKLQSFEDNELVLPVFGV